MEIGEKIKLLGSAAKYDLSCSSYQKDRAGICHSFLPDGRCVTLFKTLMTNSCKNDCKYCVNRCNRAKTKVSFEPKEIADITLKLYRQNVIEGLFLSSGIPDDSDKTMSNMIEAAKILRFERKFKGYIHLKIIPGASKYLVDEACKIANRVSINVESCSSSYLNELASQKDFKNDILRRMFWVNENKVESGHTTQFVVGAGNESDKEIVDFLAKLYDKFNLRRGYFSAFSPIKQTPLENKKPVPLKRETRLYNVDWLLRIYKFNVKEIIYNNSGNLDLNKDPKTVVAEHEFKEKYPLDVNKAEFKELIRVPGVGIQSAKRIMTARKAKEKISKWEQLSRIGVVKKRAEPFLKVDGFVQKTLLGCAA